MVEGPGQDTHARLETLRLRLRRCVAVLTASRRRHEVVEVVSEARSDEEAAEAVGELLDVDPHDANQIVEMPVKSFSKERVSHLEDEAGRLEQRVAALKAGEPERRSDG